MSLTPTPTLPLPGGGGLESARAYTKCILDDFNLTPVIASEIEFYLSSSPPCAGISDTDDVLAALKEICTQHDISFYKIEKEQGKNQYEIALAPMGVEECIRQTVALKLLLAPYADFSAKPYADQPGSGLHIHVHLADKNGKNTFYKDDEFISESLQYSIGGLLATMQENMSVFAPTTESLKRFVTGSNAPLTVSWGANNRTCAIRLPQKPHESKHIEHRVAGADADPAAVIAAILAGIHHGLTNRLTPGAQIFGDAALEKYGLLTLFSGAMLIPNPKM